MCCGWLLNAVLFIALGFQNATPRSGNAHTPDKESRLALAPHTTSSPANLEYFCRTRIRAAAVSIFVVSQREPDHAFANNTSGVPASVLFLVTLGSTHAPTPVSSREQAAVSPGSMDT